MYIDMYIKYCNITYCMTISTAAKWQSFHPKRCHIVLQISGFGRRTTKKNIWIKIYQFIEILVSSYGIRCRTINYSDELFLCSLDCYLLVHVMACLRLPETKALSGPMPLSLLEGSFGNKLQQNFNWITHNVFVIQQNAFQKVICKMLAILSRLLRVNQNFQ